MIVCIPIETHAEFLVTQDPYDEIRWFDPALGPIAINSTMFSYEFILVQTPVNWTEQETYTTPLWVSAYRQPFQRANFPFELYQEVSITHTHTHTLTIIAKQHSL